MPVGHAQPRSARLRGIDDRPSCQHTLGHLAGQAPGLRRVGTLPELTARDTRHHQQPETGEEHQREHRPVRPWLPRVPLSCHVVEGLLRPAGRGRRLVGPSDGSARSRVGVRLRVGGARGPGRRVGAAAPGRALRVRPLHRRRGSERWSEGRRWRRGRWSCARRLRRLRARGCRGGPGPSRQWTSAAAAPVSTDGTAPRARLRARSGGSSRPSGCSTVERRAASKAPLHRQPRIRGLADGGRASRLGRPARRVPGRDTRVRSVKATAPVDQHEAGTQATRHPEQDGGPPAGGVGEDRRRRVLDVHARPRSTRI